MTIIDQQMLWRQFGAAIDMLGDALRDCPDELWEKNLWDDQPDQWVAAGFSTFWYLGYHTLFWLDLYLTGAEEGFAPPAPFDLVEAEQAALIMLDPATFSAVPGTWGERGSTFVQLQTVERADFQAALKTAWRGLPQNG